MLNSINFELIVTVAEDRVFELQYIFWRFENIVFCESSNNVWLFTQDDDDFSHRQCRVYKICKNQWKLVAG